MAKECEGLVDMPNPTADRAAQAPQGPADRHGPKYDNDVAAGWLRGSGAAGATAKPCFDKHKAGR